MKNVLKITLISVLLINIISTACSVTHPVTSSTFEQPRASTIISIIPNNGTASTPSIGEQYNITVRLDDVMNLYGLDLVLRWGSEVLNYSSHQTTIGVEDYPNGVIHKTIFWITDTYAQELGKYSLAVTSLGEKTFNGSGTIFNMTFNVIAEGECYIYLESSTLTDNETPVQSIAHETTEGFFYWPGLGRVPIADFTVSPDGSPFTPEPDVIQDKEATFNATSSYDPDGGNIRLYIWEFGDGAVENTTEPVTTHVYSLVFAYEVRLMVVDDQGGGSQSKVTKKDIRVTAPNPVSLFTYWPGTEPNSQPGPTTPGNIVYFNASDSFDPDPDGMIMNYTWVFGDGNITVLNAGETTITHIYDSLNGTVEDAFGLKFEVNVTVIDSEGLKGDLTQKVYIVERRDVSVENVKVSPEELKQGQQATIDVTLANHGHTDEYFNINAYYNVTESDWVFIGQQAIGGMIGQNKTIIDEYEPMRWELASSNSTDNPINGRIIEMPSARTQQNNDTRVLIGDSEGFWTINPKLTNDAQNSTSLIMGDPLSTGGWMLEDLLAGITEQLYGEFEAGTWTISTRLNCTSENVTGSIWVRILKSDNPNPQAVGATSTVMKDWTQFFSPVTLPTSSTLLSGNVTIPKTFFDNEYLYFEFQLEITENLAGNTTEVIFHLGGRPISKTQIKPTAFIPYTDYSLQWNTEFASVGRHNVMIEVTGVTAETNDTNNIGFSESVLVTERPTIPQMDVQIEVGTLHFIGETAEFYVLVSSSGRRVNASTIDAFLTFDGTRTSIDPANIESVTTGVYLIQYNIPITAQPGTYLLVVDSSRPVEELNVTQWGTGMKGFLVSATFSNWNATLSRIDGEIATILTEVGEIQTNLNEINASLSGLISTANGELLAEIQTSLGPLTARLDQINATLQDIQGDIGNIESSLGNIETSIGSVQTTMTYGLTAAAIFSLIAAIVAVLILLGYRKA